jgi:hypothetical protein
MIDKMNASDRETLDSLYQEHFGPVIAAQADDLPIWVLSSPGQPAQLHNGDLDSIDRVEFMMAIEDAFKVEIPDEVAMPINSKQQLEQILGELLDTARRDPH